VNGKDAISYEMLSRVHEIKFGLHVSFVAFVLLGHRNNSTYLWSPCVADADIIFWSCFFFFFLFSLPNLSGRRLDFYHTSTHGVALVQI